MHVKFELGDLVIKNKNEDNAYVVVFVDKNRKYQIMQVMPLIRVSMIETVSENEIKLSAKEGSLCYELVMALIMREREKRGWTEKPDFLFEIEFNKNPRTSNINNDLSVVRYDRIGNIDECLDALNDLRLLHKRFGDEVYLQLYEVVEKRLKELV
ncbi:hypothetical protein JDW21_19530 [Bacillus subtilis]|uniref:hypothetical protein n=1 Tax=Bacillus subtilis TaxID=1423 RepID=UPI002ED4C043